jgi:hypothetical protein
VLPQLIPLGDEATLPEPDLLTVRAKSPGGGEMVCGLAAVVSVDVPPPQAATSRDAQSISEVKAQRASRLERGIIADVNTVMGTSSLLSNRYPSKTPFDQPTGNDESWRSVSCGSSFYYLLSKPTTDSHCVQCCIH